MGPRYKRATANHTWRCRNAGCAARGVTEWRGTPTPPVGTLCYSAPFCTACRVPMEPVHAAAPAPKRATPATPRASQWHSLSCELTNHTVDHEGVTYAGFLVRDAASRLSMGFVWARGDGMWLWCAATAANGNGINFTKREAVESLRDGFDFGGGGKYAQWQRAAPAAPAAPVKPAAPPVRGVVWGDASNDVPDLAATIAAALKRHQEKK
jgi:hypothetical protein